MCNNLTILHRSLRGDSFLELLKRTLRAYMKASCFFLQEQRKGLIRKHRRQGHHIALVPPFHSQGILQFIIRTTLAEVSLLVMMPTLLKSGLPNGDRKPRCFPYTILHFVAALSCWSLGKQRISLRTRRDHIWSHIGPIGMGKTSNEDGSGLTAESVNCLIPLDHDWKTEQAYSVTIKGTARPQKKRSWS